MTLLIVRLFLGMDRAMPQLLIVGAVLGDKFKGAFSVVHRRNQPGYVPRFHSCPAEEKTPVPCEDLKGNVIGIFYSEFYGGCIGAYNLAADIIPVVGGHPESIRQLKAEHTIFKRNMIRSTVMQS